MISNHLKQASERYNQTGDLIAPISSTDIQIVDQIIRAVSKTNKELSNLINHYKEFSDKEILQALTQFNERFIEDDNIEEGDSTWIKIQEKLFIVHYIVSFEKNQVYEDQRSWFTIIMNKGPLPTSHCNYEDTVFKFASIDQRDRVLRDIERRLEETGRSII